MIFRILTSIKRWWRNHRWVDVRDNYIIPHKNLTFWLSDEEMHKQSWNDFVMSLDPDYEELVQYLKERRLYVNEPIIIEEEV